MQVIVNYFLSKFRLLTSTYCVGTATASEWPHDIYASSRISDRKSIFLAHASTLPNATSFPSFLAYLTSLPTLKRATHCMYAYRTSDLLASQPVLGQNDGGESGSGDRLARLLELAGCENTVVVVSRWYGGVHLGSDRWRLISSVANEALSLGGFKRPKPQSEGKKGPANPGKRHK
ncbi:ribosomal protein S5 domain 2-like protein [Coprinellus micaceus]|uniref:Ribosomal protein S5 domain 2-like protein n=1 Tax=Coprinellus micaceus TaxID=71717 RepID=A0A4Y7TTE0_COPMI|nr:ribosomal protein S5 domain 2-like protein [Coprinellus micaceus]